MSMFWDLFFFSEFINGSTDHICSDFIADDLTFLDKLQPLLYPENPEGTHVIVGSMNMGYDIV